MLDVMMMTKNAIESYNTQLRITASNIANLEVAGYKRSTISFQTLFERQLRAGMPASSTTDIGGTNSIRLGSGMSIGSVGVDFTQGTFAEGQNYDLAIQGNGLFIVSPDGGETKLYTRNGQFEINANGDLVTKNGGMQVYGLDSAGNLVPIKLSSFTATDRSNMSWTSNGELYIYDGSDFASVPPPSPKTFTGYTIALTSFNNLTGLQPSTGTTFAETVSSGPALDAAAPGSTYGLIAPRNYEQSNVFLTSETIDSMAAQSALNGNLSILKAINDAITNFVNKIG